jgi:hypothetical protein
MWSENRAITQVDRQNPFGGLAADFRLKPVLRTFVSSPQAQYGTTPASLGQPPQPGGVVFLQLQLQRTFGPAGRPCQGMGGEKLAGAAEAAGQENQSATDRATLRRSRQRFQAVLPLIRLALAHVSLAVGHGVDRAAADSGELGDLALAEFAFGQEALDVSDSIFCDHVGCSLGLAARKKGPSP